MRGDIELSERVPQTSQTQSPVYRLAFADQDFLRLDALRGARLQLEYLKPEMILEERGLRSTIIMFGGARIPAPGAAAEAKTEIARKNLEASARYYDEARAFARFASEESLRRDGKEFVVVTGGGPGVMEPAISARKTSAPSPSASTSCCRTSRRRTPM